MVQTAVSELSTHSVFIYHIITHHILCTDSDGTQFGGTEDEPLAIYAVNGFMDLDITGNTSSYREGTMYCGDDLSSSCDIHDDSGSEWQCAADGPSTCNSGEVHLESISQCNHSQPVAIEISFDYLVDHELGVSKDTLDSIIYDITSDFVHSEIPGVSDCVMEHEDVIHSDFLSAGICYECKEIDAVNASLSLTALAESFADTFHHGTDRLMLLNGSTEVELTVNVLSDDGDNTVYVVESAPAEYSATFNPFGIKFAMSCAVAFTLIMTLCWMRYMLQRKPAPMERTAGGNVVYRRGHEKSGDDVSCSADSGHSSSPSTARSKVSVPSGSSESGASTQDSRSQEDSV